MRHGSHHCDHDWARDDAHTMQCVQCGKRKGVENDAE